MAASKMQQVVFPRATANSQRRFTRRKHIQRSFIKKLFRKVLQTSLEGIVIRVLFYLVAGLELATLSK